MESDATLDKVVGNIFNVEDFNFTDDELKIATISQIKKVLNQIVNMDKMMLSSVAVLYMLIMIKEKTKNVKLPEIGISNETNRELFEKVSQGAYEMAVKIFDEKIVNKINKA